MTTEVRKASHTGELEISDPPIPCAVLEDETRVLSLRGMDAALGRAGRAGSGSSYRRRASGNGDARLPAFLGASNLREFIDDELAVALSEQIRYTPARGGPPAYGIRADLLPKICDVWLRAREANALSHQQMHVAQQTEILTRGLAHVGIISLVDEATGYQQVRARRALEEILEKFISKELRKWIKTFPDEFYIEMFRLRAWQYNSGSIRKRPGVVGRFTNDLIYERLAPGVLDELHRITPRDSKGRTKQRYFQRLTEDVGHPRLREHLTAVIALMRASSNWSNFYRLMQRAFPKHGDNIELPISDEHGQPV